MFIKLKQVNNSNHTLVNTNNITRMFPHGVSGTWVCLIGTGDMDVLVVESMEQIMELINEHK